MDLIRTNFRKSKLSITTEQIDEAINMLIDDGYLEGMGTSYRLSAMGKVYWENHSLLEEVNRLTAEVKKARQISTLALIASLISIAAVLLFQMLRIAQGGVSRLNPSPRTANREQTINSMLSARHRNSPYSVIS